MMTPNRKLFIAAAFLIGAVVFGACSSASTNTVATGNTNAASVANTVNADKPSAAPENSNAKLANATADTRPTAKNDEILSADTSKAEKIGVAECDEYVAKYEACLNKVPEAQREKLSDQMETMRKGWKAAATNPQAKSALAGGCKVALTTAKSSMSAYSCDW